ncbi:MAG: radical SAM protein [Candidatus Scalindua sp.]
MRPLLDMDVIQIEITNACVHQCSNCTRLVGHAKKPFFMEMDFFVKAVDSLIDYPKMIGIMGGEPLLHPQFAEMAVYLKSKVPDKIRCGLWSTLPKGKEKYAQIIADVFGNVLLNDHTLGDLNHSPMLVAAQDVVADEFSMWYLIDRCWVQNCWSGSITPKGAFFCEVAAAFDMVFEGPGGWPVAPGWWKKTPKDYVEQMNRYCVNCSAALPLHARRDTEEIDDVSQGNLEQLTKIGSPKIRRGKYTLYNKGERNKDYHINEFRNNFEYAQKIASKYDLQLKPNKIGYFQPFLKENKVHQNIKDSKPSLTAKQPV